MSEKSRRGFLKQISTGMIVAGVGSSVAADLGFSAEFATKGDNELSFGKFDRLVDMMQELPPEKLQAKIVEKIKGGSLDLKQIVGAAALANAETFGGTDYVGFHTEMALVPALEMARELPSEKRALPVLKVLYRNAQQIQKVGGAKKKSLKKLDAKNPAGKETFEKIRNASRKGKMAEADQHFASVSEIPVGDQFNVLLHTIEDDINVHRFVLAHRAHELIGIVGEKHAHTMFRQCVRLCVDHETGRIRKGRPPSPIRKLLPKLVDQYKLKSRKPGTKDPGDKWVNEMANLIYRKNKFEATEAAAAALAEGISPNVIAEANALAANMLVLRQGADRWRTHGDSAGVHGSDAANAWRQMILVSNDFHKMAGLLVAVFHTARYQPFKGDMYPLKAHREKIKTTSAKELLGIANEAIRSNDQPAAAAAIQIYGEQGHSESPVFDLMRKYSISEDGRLHAEKYYRTVVEEFNSARKPFKWRQLVGLARVTASAYGYDRQDNKGHRAPGYLEACELLGVKA